MRKSIKCLVWDLDGTVWHGVQDEGFIIRPREGVAEVLATLERRGIINSAASNMSEESARDILTRFGLWDFFLLPKFGWGPKSDRIELIARELNIDTAHIAFIDDSPFQRASVSSVLPQVYVLPHTAYRSLLADPVFAGNTDPLDGGVTPESKRRSTLYREREERQAAEETFGGDRPAFLHDCAIDMAIDRAREEDLPRLRELINRTNQLNATAIRYTLAELSGRFAKPDIYVTYIAALRDRFGDYGQVGALFVRYAPALTNSGPSQTIQDKVWTIELLVASCRVEGRSVPAAMIITLLRDAQAAGVSQVQALYRRTERNRPTLLLYQMCGFRTLGKLPVAADVGLADESDDPPAEAAPLIVLAIDLSAPLPEWPPWLHLVPRWPVLSSLPEETDE